MDWAGELLRLRQQPPGGARVLVTANALSGEVVRTVTELALRHRYLLLTVPFGGEELCRRLRREYGVSVLLNPTAEQMAEAAVQIAFDPVEAAGGVVVNDCGEWLMIHRNGRWDLPKGHLEAGESLAACAEREIAEETGIAARVERPLCETLHAYWFAKTARWELKRTHWFRLRPAGAGTPAPQTEEGIDSAVWCAPREVADNLRDAFPTIRRVAEAMEE